MKAAFWHQKWEAGQIGFHKSEPNPSLVRHLDDLGLAEGARVFLPLCGKTLDIGWLVSKGFRVAGAELSELAVQQLFEELGRSPDVTDEGPLQVYRTAGIEIFVGDIFDLSAETLGPVDAVYDRAALVALPEDMRGRYAGHVATISGRARQLLITFAYDQNLMAGPPFSVTSAEVARLYQSHCDMQLLDRTQVAGGLKGFCPAEALIWLMR